VGAVSEVIYTVELLPVVKVPLLVKIVPSVPLKVSEELLPKLRVPVFSIVTVAAACELSTVTVVPAAIVAISPAIGWPFPPEQPEPQVPAALQSPVVCEVQEGEVADAG